MSQTLDRALSILSIVAQKPCHINEIAVQLGVHHSTALRLLHTLRKHGFVFELPDHRYRLGSATFRLGFQALEGIDLRSLARPAMQRLNDITGETVHLGILEDNDVFYVEKIEAVHPGIRMHSLIGAAAPLHCTGVAKAILAYLAPERRQDLLKQHELHRYTEHTLTSIDEVERDLALGVERGYVLDAEEHDPGVHCVAAPIFSGSGEVAGGMSISVPVSRVDRETLLGFAPALLKESHEISKLLGWSKT
ncbi:IclR family transcriptional regulator [Arthrobacter globiformis]|nr:IclR family transcriptional regulator [Arthrobacter globiformis]